MEKVKMKQTKKKEKLKTLCIQTIIDKLKNNMFNMKQYESISPPING